MSGKKGSHKGHSYTRKIRIGKRRKGIMWEYNYDGLFPERWDGFWKKYWRRWRRRREKIIE
jgi:hypothetical protein